MISVCMPYWHRQAALDRSLEAYRRLYADSLEIVIAADGCDVTAPGCTVVNLPPKTKAMNPCVPINRAVEGSTGDVIVLTNPEILHTKPVLNQMRESLDHPDRYVIAACWHRSDTKGKGWWVAHSSCKAGQGGRLPMPEGSGFHFCAMLNRTLWDKAGGFDEDYRDGHACDDNDWLWRLESAGAKFLMRDDLVVQHFQSEVNWGGRLARNRRLLKQKWGHRWNELNQS